MEAEYAGHTVWFFPDGDLPPAGNGTMPGHESLIILNPGERDAAVVLTIYFEQSEAGGDGSADGGGTAACAASAWTSRSESTAFPSASTP